MSVLRTPVTRDDHILGDDDAPVTLVEYGDYQCPHCAMAHGVVKRVQRHFGNQLRYAFRHFPLAQIHPLAEPAAEAAEFAAANGKFWPMHDGIYTNQDQLGFPLLFALANALDLAESLLRDALESRVFRQKVQAQFTSGVRSGVDGTPTFFLNGYRYEGSGEFEPLVDAIEATLGSARELRE